MEYALCVLLAAVIGVCIYYVRVLVTRSGSPDTNRIDEMKKYADIAVMAMEQLDKCGKINKADKKTMVTEFLKEYGFEDPRLVSTVIEASVYQLPQALEALKVGTGFLSEPGIADAIGKVVNTEYSDNETEKDHTFKV